MRRAVVAAAVAGMLLAAGPGMAYLVSQHHPGAPAAAARQVRDVAAPATTSTAPAIASTGIASTGIASAGTASAGAAARSRVATSPLPSATGSPGVPPPFVQPFAQQPAAVRTTARPSPTGEVTVPVNIDGCDHDYGETGVCVPWTFPAGVTDRCAWLRAHGFGPLAVKGTDRLGLDTNHDAVACGPGDT